jgi:hypothetical protein
MMSLDETAVLQQRGRRFRFQLSTHRFRRKSGQHDAGSKNNEALAPSE